MNKTIFFSVFVTVFFMGVQTNSQSLTDSIILALKNNQTLKNQKVLLDNSNQNYETQVGKMLPSISLSGNGTRTWNFKSGQEQDTYGISLNSSYTLYDFGVLDAKKKSANFSVQAAQVSYRKFENDLIFQVIKTHLELYKKLKIVDLYQSSLGVRKQQFEAISNRFELGEATRSELLGSKASISGAEAQLKIAVADMKKSIREYKTIVGILPTIPLLPEIQISYPTSLDESIKSGLENDFMLKILRINEEAFKQDYKAAKAGRMPILNLTGSIGYGDSQTMGNNYSTGSVSLNSTLSLYSGGQKKAQLEIASNNLTAKVIEIAIRKEELERNINIIWLDLVSLKSSELAKQEEFNALEELYNSVFEEWQLGGKTSLDADQAYQNLLNSEVELVSTKIDKLIVKFKLLADMGTLKNELSLR